MCLSTFVWLLHRLYTCEAKINWFQATKLTLRTVLLIGQVEYDCSLIVERIDWAKPKRLDHHLGGSNWAS
jgi:hypothetical protein